MKKKILFIIITFFAFIGMANAEEYPEEIQQKLESDFEKYFPNNELQLNSYQPTTLEELNSLLTIKAIDDELPSYYYYLRVNNCNTDFTECDGTTFIRNTPEDYTLTRKIKIKYENLNQKISKKVNKLIENYKNKYTDKTVGSYIRKDIRIGDLDLVNYFYYSFKEGEDPTSKESMEVNSINFISEIKNDLENSNFKYKFISTGCDINLQLFSDSHTAGILVLYYKDSIYGTIDIDLGYNNIIYVPTNTPKDEEKTVQAAKERLKKYFGKDFEMHASRKTEIDNGEAGWAVGDGDITRFGDIETMSENIYTLNINGIEYEFLIIRDSSKMIKPKHKTKELDNDISVTLNDEAIPFDTLIEAENIEDNEDYKKVIGEDNVYTFDIKLHSKTLNSNISKTEKGTFIVQIPVPENLKNKKIIAYFINEKNELEKHEVKVENGYATFETNHFSTYSLTEEASKEEIKIEEKEENPETSSKTSTILLISVISSIVLVISSTKMKEISKKI